MSLFSHDIIVVVRCIRNRLGNWAVFCIEFFTRGLSFIIYRQEVDSITTRPDKKGAHRANYERNKKRILATNNVCGICGFPVDLSLKHGDPMAATVDHIIPVAKGGHPSDIENLQLAHWTCNRQKSDKIFRVKQEEKVVIGNRNLPQSMDWSTYKSN